jgi:hypothetical protein
MPEHAGVESAAVPAPPNRHEDSRAMLEPSPCDNCARSQRCAAEYLCCSAFAAFLHGADWRFRPRVDATRARYQALLGDAA